MMLDERAICPPSTRQLKRYCSITGLRIPASAAGLPVCFHGNRIVFICPDADFAHVIGRVRFRQSGPVQQAPVGVKNAAAGDIILDDAVAVRLVIDDDARSLALVQINFAAKHGAEPSRCQACHTMPVDPACGPSKFPLHESGRNVDERIGESR